VCVCVCVFFFFGGWGIDTHAPQIFSQQRAHGFHIIVFLSSFFFLVVAQWYIAFARCFSNLAARLLTLAENQRPKESKN